jgi:hypothetical protein
MSISGKEELWELAPGVRIASIMATRKNFFISIKFWWLKIRAS